MSNARRRAPIAGAVPGSNRPAKRSGKTRRPADLTDSEILEIKYSRDTYETLARKFDLSKSAIQRIKAGMIRPHVGPTDTGWRGRGAPPSISLTEAEILEIKYSRDTYATLARKFDVSNFIINKIKAGVLHPHIGPTETGWRRSSGPPSNILTQAVIREIENSSDSHRTLARRFGVSTYIIGKIKTGKRDPNTGHSGTGWTGRRGPPLKISDERVALEIKNSRETYRALAKRFGVSRETIRRIKDGVIWPHLGDGRKGWKRKSGEHKRNGEDDRESSG